MDLPGMPPETGDASLIIFAVVLAVASAGSFNWKLLYRDPDQGSVYYDPASVWSREGERAVTAKLVFDRPKPGEVATIVTRIEIDCAAQSFAASTGTAFDASGRTVYAKEFAQGRAKTKARASSPMLPVIAELCQTSPE
jgi:hypothetical protein